MSKYFSEIDKHRTLGIKVQNSFIQVLFVSRQGYLSTKNIKKVKMGRIQCRLHLYCFYFYYFILQLYNKRIMRGGKDRRQRGGGDTQISKTLSWVLRHGAVEEGLTIEPSGYVPLEEVMQFLRRKGCKNIDEDKIRHIVDNNDKKRFEIEERKHHKFIRATQGHSMKIINTEELLTKITDPSLYPIVVHGTFSKFWGLIKEGGLKRMTRNHIHFAPGMPKEEGVVSGMRGTCDVIIEIDLAAAMKDGIQFFISTNNVILTEGQEGVLKPQYFSRVTRRDGTLIQGKQQAQKKQQPEELQIKPEHPKQSAQQKVQQ